MEGWVYEWIHDIVGIGILFATICIVAILAAVAVGLAWIVCGKVERLAKHWLR